MPDLTPCVESLSKKVKRPGLDAWLVCFACMIGLYA